MKKPPFDKNSPEGQYMELVALEGDSKKKLALLEQFPNMFPTSEPTVCIWLYSELQDRYRSSGALDKAIATGEKVLVCDPENIDAARVNWKIAEAKKDSELVRKWSGIAGRIAERLVNAPIPPEPEVLKAAQEIAAFSKQTAANTEFAEYSKAIAVTNVNERLAALDAFVRKSPNNPYAAQIEITQFQAYKELGDLDKTLAAAEKIVARDENKLDALLFVAEVNFRRKKDLKRSLELANKVREKIATAVKPANEDEQEWQRARNQNTMMAHYIAGNIYFQAQQWGAADQALRGTLPFIKDDQLRASTLYNLGWANYQMKAAVEAIKFYGLCAQIPGPMQEQAAKNVLAVKSEYSLQ